MSKATMWQAWKPSAIATPDGPVPVATGDIVVVLVVPKWSDAFAAMQALLAKDEKRGE